jgi:GNAT superfamily N-acetyltransferase
MPAIAAIRTATLEDSEALDDLHRRSSFVWEEDHANLEAHPEALGVPRARIEADGVRVAVDASGAILGFSGISDGGAGVCELEDLFVEPDLMRQGIGRQLVEDLVGSQTAAGARAVEVTAAPRTFGFYESVGFVVGETTPTQFGPAARLRRELP